MTWVEGCDYAYSHPDPAGMYAADLRFVLRYFSHTPGKGLTVAERDALWAAGLAIGGLYESTATRALAGYAAGQSDAKLARSIARSLGYPDSLPIIFAVDFQATATQLSGPVSDYFRGIASVEAGDEAYGGIATINALVKNHLSAGGFQTYAWSSGQWSPSVQIEQYHNGATVAGGVVDRCRALSTVKFWRPGGAVGDGGVVMPVLDQTDLTAIRDMLLHTRLDGVAPLAPGATQYTVQDVLRMMHPRVEYLALSAAPALLGDETSLAAQVVAVKAELDTVKAAADAQSAAIAGLPAAVVAALPAGELSPSQIQAVADAVTSSVRSALAAADTAAAASLAGG